MRIYILSRGPLAEKVVNNLVEHGFADMIVGIHEYPENLHGELDDLDALLPPDPPKCDLLIALYLHPDVAPVIPRAAQLTGAREVLVPIEDWHMMREGLRRQIERELDEIGVAHEFPKPFCQIETSRHPLIRAVAEKLGKPRFVIEERGGTIVSVRTERDTPCGSARFVAQKLVGADVSASREKAIRAHHDYPCLAGMDTDPILKNEIMHIATECLCEQVAKALGKGGAKQPGS